MPVLVSLLICLQFDLTALRAGSGRLKSKKLAELNSWHLLQEINSTEPSRRLQLIARAKEFLRAHIDPKYAFAIALTLELVSNLSKYSSNTRKFTS